MFLIQDMLKIAVEMRASDLHIAAGIPPKCRVNGSLISITNGVLSPETTEMLVMNILTDSQKEELEKLGEIDCSYSVNGLGRFRVNAFRQKGTYGVAIRLINNKIPMPEELGLSKFIVDVTEKKSGLVLVTGPTGSGKSTTLAALINEINTNSNRHIITLEDPIEYLHEHNKSIINQREIGSDTMSYAAALRAALRQDPDVILVGEMRDFDTISIAITAAETGHLVFSTLHTIGAVSTIDRIIDVFPPHQQQQIRVQLSGVLRCVVSQQLIPKKDKSGRVAAFEVMFNSIAIQNLIREGKGNQIATIMQTSRRDGMVLMDDFLLELYNRQLIDMKYALAYAQDPTVLAKKMV
ncbi:type IV pilus twitching motility protein PilT [Anaerosporobacter faecicola]|uniref:type IV pilus twitching motility protein PilT n=1 Tax=Anaerosporobacter faecicola TaxID=2718714 RepID=UPI00143925C1|nr:type IV pilus twitching motility protein PilT [Anaerosporobacter faecicola]